MTNIHRILGPIVLIAIGLLMASRDLRAQYSQTVFDLKKASDLYDERGFEQGKAISVDGKLVVSNSNGNVSYSYPISSHMEGGHPMDVTLNYCGSVAFTAFTKYRQANRPGSSGPGAGGLYTGWEKFQQNRPAWILGVNGFAINAIATTSHFHADPHSSVHSGSVTSFDDADLIWTIDGYDVSNRMYDFGAVGAGLNGGTNYVDEINLLRADGSVMHLINIQPPSASRPDVRPELYTGYYLANEPNTSGFGYVELDSTYWSSTLQLCTSGYDTIPKGGRDTVDSVTHQIVIIGEQDSIWYRQLMPGQEYPLIPRKLHYYPGDGLEYVFREWRAPYGTSAYRDLVERGGGYWGGPSIFYLEEIRGGDGPITSFTRARQYPIFGNPMFESREDSTRGRALITSFPGHQLSFGYNSMIIEGMGRTTKVVFDTIARSGNALASETMPLANNGGITPLSLGLATYAETNAALYKSFVGYVTKIIDPENRVTSFEYEPVTRTYQNMGFPYTPVSGNVNLALKNYRLKAVNEPSARYVLKYYGSTTQTITTSTASAMDGPQRLNDVVDSVLKYDLAGNPLTATKYYFEYNSGYDNFTDMAQEFYRDMVTDSSRTTTYEYRPDQLPNLTPLLPPARFTELYRVTESAGEVTTISTTNYTSTGTTMTINGFGTTYPITGTVLPTPYMILPASVVTTINGTAKSRQSYSYVIDTARTYGGNAELAGLFGGELATKVTTTLRPDAPTIPLLVDTVRYLHLRYIDTVMSWRERQWNKFASIAQFLHYRDVLGDARMQAPGSWERWMSIPPIGVYDTVEMTELVHIPPLFGLESYTSTSDAGGVQAGKINQYLSDLQDGQNRYLRGQLLADTIIGRGGARLPGNLYEWDGPYLVATVNANGARREMGYDYAFVHVDSNGDTFLSPGNPAGTKLANDWSAESVTMSFNPFERQYGKPGAERSIVRRYDGDGLVSDSLSSYYEHTFFGQVAGAIDPNGWYSRFSYDKIGRLRTAWLPYDFARVGELDTVSYVGNEPIELYGTTNYQRRPDVLECRKVGGVVSSTVIEGTPITSTLLDTLYAYRPPTDVPACPCEDDPEYGKRGVRDLLATCNQDLPYNEHSGFDGFYGVLGVRVDASSPLRRAASIDSVWLEMLISSINGDCGELEVTIPGTDFTRTFVLSCSSEPELPDNPGNRVTGIGEDDRSKREGASLLAGDGSSLRPVAGGYLLHVNLESIVDTLKARSGFYVELRSKTVGTSFVFASGFSGADVRPRINVYGRYKRVWDGADYTLNYAHNDTTLTTVIRAKVDDAEHSASHIVSPEIRRATSKHYFGADYRVLRTDDTVILAGGTQRVDSIRARYSGAGAALVGIDQDRDSVRTRYDAAGRPIETINADGTHVRIAYADGTPGSFGLTAEYYGYARRVTTTDERGIVGEQYYDAFDRLRREVRNAGGSPALATQYEYDLLGRLTSVTNPKGDVTSYTYDDFGRVATKSMADLGTVSYAYDALGNVRFTQSQEQFAHNLLGFTEYDDLNRPTLIGEAVIDRESICGPYAEDYLTGGCALTVPDTTTRLTAQADPTRLHIGAMSDTTILTSNPTLAMAPMTSQPRFFINGSSIEGIISTCLLPASPLLGETSAPVGPLLRHWAENYEAHPTTATLEEFEDMAAHTEFARIAISYDRLPDPGVSVWKQFPPAWQWNVLSPRGQVMNLKGHEAAVAYRERASEPFHYTVLSYDERGRVEAILRCTENIGFDAVYYHYNSMNLVTSVTSSDALRSHTTWYGYDHQGRVDSVWTELDTLGSGLLPLPRLLPPPGSSSRAMSNLHAPQQIAVRAPAGTPDITYEYTKVGQVATMSYPPAGVVVDYTYNGRKWLTNLLARQPMVIPSMVFSEQLRYDSSGQIIEQRSQHGFSAAQVQRYGYDSTDRLTWWTQHNGSDTVVYSYDDAGNRTEQRRSWDVYPENYTIIAGRNQLESRSHHDYEIGDTNVVYQYNGNGSATRRRMELDSSKGAWTSWPPQLAKPVGTGWLYNEQLRYSYRNLLNRVYHTDSSKDSYDWRYRYSASGEREGKRLVGYFPWIPPIVTHPVDTPKIAQGWVYYLLGASNEQLAVYHGQQDTGNVCGDTVSGVSMYPVEYLTHGIGYTGVPEDISQVITDGSGQKQYRISDHLATLRATVDGDGISSYDSDPWGGTLEAPATGGSRRVFNDREKDRETGNLNLGVRSEEPELGRFLSVDPLLEKSAWQSPYVYADNNPLRLTDPTGKQAGVRVPYVATVEWLMDMGRGGGGGGGALPLMVVGGLYIYATQHPEESVPFMVGMAVNVSQALTNPIGFAAGTISGAIVASDNNKWKDQVEGFVDNINLHLGFLEGTNGSHGSPNGPYNSDKWKKDIRKAINNIKDKLGKLKKPFDQVLKERGWDEKQIEDLRQRLQDQGIEPPK